MRALAYIAALFFSVNIAYANTDSDNTAESPQYSAEQIAYIQEVTSVWQSLNKQTGEIKLANAVATVNIPQGFIYLNPQDTETFLVKIWGNPPSSLGLGMIMPATESPLEIVWGVTLDFQADGYVEDGDAEDIDYSDLLDTMKEDVAESSKAMVRKGYGSVELLGWASKPYYDKASHKLHWAKEMHFEGQTENTLNYNIRVLGRKGVLVMNFIADMSSKSLIDEKLATVVAMANFDQGARYEDFNPEYDQVAAYGLGALVAGKVMAKTGLFVALLLALKKLWIFIAIGFVSLFNWLRNRKNTET